MILSADPSDAAAWQRTMNQLSRTSTNESDNENNINDNSNNLVAKYGKAAVTVSRIPYARSFGDEREQKMTLREFVAYVDKQKALPESGTCCRLLRSIAFHCVARRCHCVVCCVVERDQGPDYVFQAPKMDYVLKSAAADDAKAKTKSKSKSKQKGQQQGLERLVDLFYVPRFVCCCVAVLFTVCSAMDERVTNLTTHRRAPQFYFGPKHSGAPIHYHNPAMCVLVVVVALV